MNIIKNSGFVEYRNCRERAEKIKYIVIHYTGAEGTAEDNIKYFNGGNRNASAHYFIGRDGQIYEYCDPEKWYAWHCGGSLESSHHPYYGMCTNANSIGIELCTHNNGQTWEFTPQAVASADELTEYLMQKFSVPADNIIRHYDVTGKSCPRVPGWGAVGGNAEWEAFKTGLGAETVETPKTEEKKWYRVRKSWEDASSQIGAYLILDNAIAEANNSGPKYAVYDWNGQEIYRYSEASGTKAKELHFFYPGYSRHDSPYDAQGAGCVWHDQNNNCIVVDAYTQGSEPSKKLLQYLQDNKLRNIDAVGTHAHPDHLGGFFQVYADGKITIENLYVYDPASLKLAGDGSANARSAKSDKAYLQRLIDLAKSKGTKVHYVKTGDLIECGEMSWEVHRYQPTKWGPYDTGEAWQYLNDGSICLYNRAVQWLLVGDADGADAIDNFSGDIDGGETGHHGNSGSQTCAKKWKNRGCKLVIECNIETNGPGSCGWTKYGAGRMKEAGITVWQLDADIRGVVKGGKNTVTQGSKKMEFDCPFGKVFYRVRTSWADAKSQIGAYTVLANAKDCVDKHPGYFVFDETGKIVYPVAEPAAEPVQEPEKPKTEEEIFIEKIGPMAKSDMEKNGICAAVTIAQAILESGWGKKELAINANNLFGMKKSLSGNTWSGSTWDGKSVYNKTTKEVYSSGPATVQADFRAYRSWAESVGDHSAYLRGAKMGSGLRYEGLIGCSDYKKAAQIIKDGGYATSPDYVSKLCQLVEQYGLTKWNTDYKPASSGTSALDTPAAQISAGDGLFRVRKSWPDAQSQVGAYRNPRNAIAKVKERGSEYKIFDDRGVRVYPDSYTGWFRVRKSWENAKSQISAHKYLEYALDMADSNPGYSVYDELGRKIYPI